MASKENEHFTVRLTMGGGSHLVPVRKQTLTVSLALLLANCQTGVSKKIFVW